MWRTPAGEGGLTWSPDRTRVAFTRSHADDGKDGRSVSDLWVREIDSGKEIKLTDGLGAVNPGAWSPDGKRLTFSVAQATRKAKPAPYSGAKIDYSWIERSSVDQFAIAADGGGGRRWRLRRAPSPNRRRGGSTTIGSCWSASRNSRGGEILIADAATGRRRVLHEETDAKFVSLTGDSGYTAQPSPDGKWIAYVSDRDGWDHLYVVPTSGGTPVQLTKGAFEAWRPAWSPDSTRLAYDANLADNLSSRHINVITVGAAQPQCGTQRRRSAWRRCKAGRDHERPRHECLCAVVARRLAHRLSAHGSAERGGSVGRARAPAGAAGARAARRFAAGRRRSEVIRRAGAGELQGTGRQDGARVSVRAAGTRSHEEASGDRVDSRRRRESELRRLARAAQLRRLLQLPSVSAAARLRRARARLSRQHRLRPRLAPGRAPRRRQQGLPGRGDERRSISRRSPTSTPIASASGASATADSSRCWR